MARTKENIVVDDAVSNSKDVNVKEYNDAIEKEETDGSVGVEDVVADNGNVNPVEKDGRKTRNYSKPLHSSDEIKVVSLIPNVRYKDSYTHDYYTWNNAGQEEYMTVEELERMWKNSKGYFRNMWLKPEDERIIKKFGLNSLYDKYDFLMDVNNYTEKNIEKIYEYLDSNKKELKFSICNKIKNMVATGELNDIRVIKGLESHLKIDLTSFI